MYTHSTIIQITLTITSNDWNTADKTYINQSHLQHDPPIVVGPKVRGAVIGRGNITKLSWLLWRVSISRLIKSNIAEDKSAEYLNTRVHITHLFHSNEHRCWDRHLWWTVVPSLELRPAPDWWNTCRSSRSPRRTGAGLYHCRRTASSPPAHLLNPGISAIVTQEYYCLNDWLIDWVLHRIGSILAINGDIEFWKIKSKFTMIPV